MQSNEMANSFSQAHLENEEVKEAALCQMRLFNKTSENFPTSTGGGVKRQKQA